MKRGTPDDYPFPDDEQICELVKALEAALGPRIFGEFGRLGIDVVMLAQVMPLAEGLKFFRGKCDYSVEEMAASLESTPEAIGAIERAMIHEIDPQVLQRYARLLGVEDFLASWCEAYPGTSKLLMGGALLADFDDESIDPTQLSDTEIDFVDCLSNLADGDDPEVMEALAIYEFKVVLGDVTPTVWRRFSIPGDMNLADLHEVLQIVMGWENYHLHCFKIGESIYAEFADEDDWQETEDELDVSLDELELEVGSSFTYEYDFGDEWLHTLTLERVLPFEAEAVPEVLDGKRACPPEDCGGVWGYENLLNALQDPEHSEHEMWTEWIGMDFDPEKYDVDSVNFRLASAFPPPPDEIERGDGPERN